MKDGDVGNGGLTEIECSCLEASAAVTTPRRRKARSAVNHKRTMTYRNGKQYGFLADYMKSDSTRLECR